jgi:hypothetical protein
LEARVVAPRVMALPARADSFRKFLLLVDIVALLIKGVYFRKNVAAKLKALLISNAGNRASDVAHADG